MGALPFLAALLLQVVGAQIQPPRSTVYRCCIGTTITTLLPEPAMEPWIAYDNTTQTPTGFFPKIYDLLEREMGLTITYVKQPWTMMDQYSALNSGAVNTQFTVSIESAFAPSSQVYITSPVLYISQTGVVYKSKAPRDQFVWLEPFEPELWAAIVGLLFASAVLLVAFDRARPEFQEEYEGEEQPPSFGQFCTGVYHTWAMFLGGEDYEWISWPSRIFRLGMLLFVVVVMAVYTGNMTNFFIKSSYVVHGPSSMSELKSSTACVLAPGLLGSVVPYVKAAISPSAMLSDPTWTMDMRIKFCADKLRSGEADVWMDYPQNSYRYLLEHCSEFQEVTAITGSGMFMAFAIKSSVPDAYALSLNISSALAFLQSQPAWNEIFDQEFALGQSCPENEVGDLDPVTLDSMAGLFLVYGVIVVLALGSAGYARWVHEPNADKELNHMATEGEMLKSLLSKVESVQELLGGSSTKRSRSNTSGAQRNDFENNRKELTPMDLKTIATCFDRYDYNGSETLDSAEEFAQLTTALVYNLGLKVNLEKLEAKTKQVGLEIEAQDRKAMNLEAYRRWFVEEVKKSKEMIRDS